MRHETELEFPKGKGGLFHGGGMDTFLEQHLDGRDCFFAPFLIRLPCIA